MGPFLSITSLNDLHTSFKTTKEYISRNQRFSLLPTMGREGVVKSSKAHHFGDGTNLFFKRDT